MSGERSSNNSSLGTFLAFGVGALIGAAGAALATSYVSEAQREQNHQENARAPQSNQPKARIREPCFCGNDDEQVDCYINVCGNSFHRLCLLKWVELLQAENKQITCPNCRIVFNVSNHVKAV